jgi:hypothetical protein
VTAPPLLLVVPQPLSGGASARGLVLGGLPLLRRIALAAERAGFEQILLTDPRPGDEMLLSGTPAVPMATAFAPAPGRRRVVLLADCVVPQVAWLRQLVRMAVEPEHLHADGALVGVVEAADASWIVAEAAGGRPAREVFATLRRRLKAVEGSLDRAGGLARTAAADAPAAEPWVLGAQI